MNAPIAPTPPLPAEEPTANQVQQPNDWYRFADRFCQDTRCPICEGAGHTRKHIRCPRCRGAGELPPTRNSPNSRLDYTNACHQARRLLQRTRTMPGRNSAQFAITNQDMLRLTIHLPRPYDQPLFCLTANGRHSQQIAAALARTLLQQGHAV